MRHRGANGPHRMEQVEVEGPHPILGRRRQEVLAGGAADIGDQQISPAECRGALVDEALDLARAGHVGHDAV